MLRKMQYSKRTAQYPLYCLVLGVLAGFLWGFFIFLAGGDEIHHTNGRVISGTITYEDEHKVEIKTEEYGTLVFDKANVKEIISPNRPHPTPSPGLPSTASTPVSPSATSPSALQDLLLSRQKPETNNVGPATARRLAIGSQSPPGSKIAEIMANVRQEKPETKVQLPALIHEEPPGASPTLPPPLPSVNVAMQETAVPPKTQPSTEDLAPLSVLTGKFPPPTEKVPTEPVASPISPTTTPRIPTLELSPVPTPERPTVKAGFDAVLFDVVESVKVRRGGQGWESAQEGMQLKVGDEIYTGEGKTKIQLRGRGELRLPPSSHLIIVTLNPEGTKITIELTGGRVWNNVTPGGGAVDYTVKTPDLVAGVRGTLFKVSTTPAEGSRVAVFEGEVLTVSEKTQEQVTLAPNTFVTVDQQGQISAPAAVDPTEREEWDEWDQWALDVHNQIASRFVFGGQQIDALAQLVAQDGKRYDSMMNEANQRILYNREGDKLAQLRDAFIQFYKDTGHIPSTDEGFQVLLQNPGIQNWNGPYIASTDLLKDRWGSDITYEKKQSEASGNVYGELISPGPDKIHSKGSPATDDIKVLILYFTVTR